MLMLKSMTNVEMTVLPLLPKVFATISNMTIRGYDGDMFELTYRDGGICRGL